MDNLNEKREAALDRAFARQFNDGIWIGVDFVGSYVRQQVRCQACRRYEFCDDRLTATLNDGATQLGYLCRGCLRLGPQGVAPLLRQHVGAIYEQ